MEILSRVVYIHDRIAQQLVNQDHVERLMPMSMKKKIYIYLFFI